MIYILLFLSSISAFAECSKSIKKEDLELIINKTPPAYAIRLDCNGGECVCIPEDIEPNTDSLSIYEINKNELSINEEKKVALDREKASLALIKKDKEDRVSNAKQVLLNAKSDTEKLEALTELVKAKDGL